MTKLEAVLKVTDLAVQQVGYLEKKTNADLDSKTANAGTNNYTKYARDLDNYKGQTWFYGHKQGFAWCSVFYTWLFVQAFGDKARAVLYQPGRGSDYAAGCDWAAKYYRQNNAFYPSPQIGDQIFFGAKGDEGHTGIVVDVTPESVITIEGNTNNSGSYNGNGVYQKIYKRNNSRIVGYGRPNWDLVANEKDVLETMTEKELKALIEKKAIEIADARIKAYFNGLAEKKESSWIKESGELEKAKAEGITDGTRPQSYATREEVAAMCLRSIKKTK